MQFKDRHEAGIKLAEKLVKYKDDKDVVILAIPRGGVEIGYEIAKFLNAKLDIIVTKKIGLPDDEEYAIGVVGPDKKVMLNEDAISKYSISDEYIKQKTKGIGNEIERRCKKYKGKYQLQKLNNKIVIIADDGIATGFTTKAAINFVRLQKPKKVILAAPVSPSNFAKEIRAKVDEFICLHSTERFFSISQFYESFPQLEDKEVKEYLKKANSK